MPATSVNGVHLFYELSGDGPPLVLVHGSWGDGAGWDPVVPALAARFRVLTYDRRGHSRSERPPTQGSTGEDVDDLAALIEHLELAPTHVAGVSSGGSLVLRLAARRPELVRSVAAHEPALFSLFVDDPEQGAVMREALRRFAAVASLLATGETERGTRLFVETVAYGSGGWQLIPPARQQVMINNAPTFLDEMRDPGSWTADLAALATIPRPLLLTSGDLSLPFFPAVVTALGAILPAAQMQAIEGAGHVPAASQPEAYVTAITAFATAADTAEPG